MPSLLSKEEMDVMDYGNELDHGLISTDILEDICDGIQSHPNVNRGDACYKICDCIRQGQSERKGALKATQHMDNGFHKVFKTVAKTIHKIYLWENLVQKFPVSFQNLETLLK